MVKQLTAIQKGDLLELIVQAWHESEGYETYRVPRVWIPCNAGKFRMRSVDIFGCDLICNKPGKKQRWIQVTTERSRVKMNKQADHNWNVISTSVLYYRFRRLKDKNDFIVYMLCKDGDDLLWLEYEKLPFVMLDVFEIVDAVVKKKSKVSIEKVCAFFSWSKKDYIKMRNAVKNKMQKLEV